MKTPYDTALRWRKDELDVLRRALAGLFAKRSALEADRSALEAELLREQAHANAQPFSNFIGYELRIKSDILELNKEIISLEAQIEQQQTLVAEAFNAYKVLDIAAERHREEARTTANKREQDALDEVAARHTGEE
jgi:flagellar export protein FliJ